MWCARWHLCEGLNAARFTVSFSSPFPLGRKIVEGYVQQCDVNAVPVVMTGYSGVMTDYSGLVTGYSGVMTSYSGLVTVIVG